MNMNNFAYSKHRISNQFSKSLWLYKKPISNLVIFFAILCFTLILYATETGFILSPEELKEIAIKIERVEKSISNIKIKAQSSLETKNNFYDTNEPWQETPIYQSYTVWVCAGAERKARLDVNDRISEWVDGPAPYGQESYSISFDGQQGRRIRHTFGPIGESHPVKRGEVLTDAPESLKHGFSSGVFYSLPFFDAELYKFSELFKLAADPNSEVSFDKFSLEQFQGSECIKVSSEKYGISYWLDRSHGFALRGKKTIAQHENGHEELLNFVKVTKLEEVADGVWWPTQVTSVRAPFEPNEPYKRFIYRASNVVANDPNFDESIFTVPFPEGYKIEDKVEGRTYTVGEK